MGKSKRIIFFCFFTALTFIFALFLFSCTTQEEKEWLEIKDSDSIEDFLDFAVNYKDGRRIGDVNKRIKEKISVEEDTEKLIFFANQYPERADEFKERISEIALAAALEEHTYDSLEKYIEEFANYGKNSKYINEAKSALKNMYFNEAKETLSVKLLEEFISRYENEDKIMSDEAASILDDINWSAATGAGTRSAYADYIEQRNNFNYIGKYIGEAEKILEEIDWNTAYEEYESKNILLPLKEFADSYHDSPRISEINSLIAQIQNDSSYSEKYLSDPTLDLIDEFLLYFPGHKDTEKAMQLRGDFIGDIYSFIQKGYIVTAAVGDSITRSRVVIENRSPSKLIVTIPFGTYLAANTGYIQNMLIREERTFTVDAGALRSLYLNTACMNIYKDIPDSTNYFTVNILPENSPLIKLLKVLAENNSSYEITQAAVWQIADDPGKDKILNTIIYQDGQDAITEDDYNEALRLIEIIENIQ